MRFLFGDKRLAGSLSLTAGALQRRLVGLTTGRLIFNPPLTLIFLP
jgi:hypothetical protein